MIAIRMIAMIAIAMMSAAQRVALDDFDDRTDDDCRDYEADDRYDESHFLSLPVCFFLSISNLGYVANPVKRFDGTFFGNFKLPEDYSV